jgi:hypothetical protein
MPWIHMEDQVRIILYSIDNELIRGPVNASAPNPATNREFVWSLGKALRRPAVLPVPAFALRMLLGEMSQIVLASQRVVPRALVQSGYQFRFPELREALADLFGERGSVVE